MFKYVQNIIEEVTTGYFFIILVKKWLKPEASVLRPVRVYSCYLCRCL